MFPTQVALFAMIAAFIVMIMLHELGHFVMAKRAGMKVTEFFVGFGPRLWSVKRGETEYGIKGIPLGGYCKVIGMTNLDEIDPVDEPRTYRAKSWSAKVLMASAGPAVHFIIAIVLMATVLFFAGDFRHQRATTTLGKVTAGAQAAGLQVGDKLVSIDGTAITDWGQVPDVVTGTKEHPRAAGDVVRFVVKRGDQVLDYNVRLQTADDTPTKRVVAGISSHVHLPRPGIVGSVAAAPREVGSIGWESVKALGSMFSPAGHLELFPHPERRHRPADRPVAALRLAGRLRPAREQRGQGGLGQRARLVDRHQHLRGPVQPAPAAALRRRAHRDRQLRKGHVDDPAPPGAGRHQQADAAHGRRRGRARVHLLVEPVPRHHPPGRQPLLRVEADRGLPPTADLRRERAERVLP